jgi:putative ABC transport system ATP-binding protein
LDGAPIVRLRDVSKTYGAAAVLSGVDLSLAKGQKASLIGPSGSGKSTLISLIAGLRRPTSGSVEIDGVPMSELDDDHRALLRAERIGVALQADNLIPFLSAIENIEMAMAFVPGRTRRVARARGLELLDRFGVGDRADHRPRQLSGGEAQRVALAVAVANEPAVLLADEVAAALDDTTARRIVDDLLAQDFAVLFVTHSRALADRAEFGYAIANGSVTLR